MTNKEKKEWLSVKYPLTIIRDRYDGVYSRACWLAFPLDYDEIPEDVTGDDVVCSLFWETYKEPVGKGAYANDAVIDLMERMEAPEFPEESEDERIINAIISILGTTSIYSSNGCEKPEMIAWLEKQKEQKPILEVFGFKVGDAVRLKDGDGRKHIIKSFEEVEGLHGPNFYHVEFEDNSARDGIYPGEEYPNGYYTQMEKFEEEQKPAEWSKEDENHLIWLCRIIHSRVVNKELSLAEESELGKWMDKWLNHKPQPVQKWDEFDEDCLKRAIWYVENPAPSVVKDTNLALWLKSLPERFNLQPKQEWSEEDEAMRSDTLDSLRRYQLSMPNYQVELQMRWLKSLRPQPHWKPSEEQMDRLVSIVAALRKDDCDDMADFLAEIYHGLEKL